MIGIYKITNKLNNISYIGLSNDIHKRWNSHCSSSYNDKAKDYDTAIHRAIRKYGKENFTLEVLESFDTYDYQLLTKREQYWISFYDTYHNGYNETIGGEIGNMQHGENHSRAKLTKQDVIDIRTRYANLERCMIVYEDYKDRIGRTGFNKIWKGETRKDIMPEIYTPENRQYHQLHTGNPGSYNGRAILNQDIVNHIREEMKTTSLHDIWEKEYKELMPNYRSFYNSITYKWKS